MIFIKQYFFSYITYKMIHNEKSSRFKKDLEKFQARIIESE